MAEQKKRPAPKPERPMPEVIYTQPAPLDRKKLILRLATVAAVVIALLVGFSIFFRVDTILVAGNEQYTQSDIIEASGIEIGDSLLSFGRGKASAKIAQALPYVKTIRIGIKLPGTVTISVEEVDVVYSVQDNAGDWWFMTSDAWLVEKTNASSASKKTIIQGVQLIKPKKGTAAQVLEENPDTTTESGEEVIVTITNKDRLDTVKEILNRLELNGVLGDCKSINVSDMGGIEVWYKDRYQVLLGDSNKIDVKIDKLCAIIKTSQSYESGILDLSNPDANEVSLTPF